MRQTELEEVSTSHPVVSEGMVVVDLRFEMVACDRGAGVILADFGGCSNREGHLPPEIRVLLSARPLAELTSVVLNLDIGELAYHCRAFVLEALNGSGQQTVLALHLQRAASSTDALNEVSQEYHLTDRECEVLAGVSLGLTTKTLANRMNISPNTVNAFLRLIMLKMHVTTRAGAVGRVLEHIGTTPSKNVRTLTKEGYHA
jgi:DNA-binding CsgD family transcriptional regulator